MSIEIKDITNCLINMSKKEELLGNDFDSINIYKDIYKSFPSYKKFIGSEIYTSLMDHKILHSILGTMEQRDKYLK